ncbi:MAG: CPBP family intramembrane metalloprotease [Caldisericaceae bacterium]
MFPKEMSYRNTYIFGVVYALCFLISAAVINYFTWSPGPTEANSKLFIFAIIFWTLQYLPIFIFTKYADWKIKDFGYVLNYKVLAFTAFVVVISMLTAIFNMHNLYVNYINVKSFINVLVETYARTGEEVFTRGFLYELIFRLFKNKKRPWLWAILISSICFAIVHTQTFLPESGTRMIDVFEAALLLSLIRYWTGSILPGIVIHIAIELRNLSGVIGAIFGILFYYLFVFLAYKKGEDVIEKRA